MRSNKITGVLVFAICIAAVAIAVISFSTRAQKQNPTQSKTWEQLQDEDLSQFPIADYNAPESSNPEEREKRRAKGNRYGKRPLIAKNPPPEYSGGTLHDETLPLQSISVMESEIVIVGVVLKAEESCLTNFIE